MEGYTYAPSNPDSGRSSPRSREIDYQNSSSWEDPVKSQTVCAYKVKFMCSYGGKILPRPHDNQLSYVGGETKILAVDRNIKFPAFVAKLSSFCENDSVSFKYQLPGEDFDALISVTNDEDLENLFQEYDRLYKLSPKPARLRLFLIGANPYQPPPSDSSTRMKSFGSDEGVTTKSEKERFVEALNSVPPPPLTAVAPPSIPAGNMEFLFGLEKESVHQPPPPPQQQHLQPPVVVGRGRDPQQTVGSPVQEPDLPNSVSDDKLSWYPIQKNMQGTSSIEAQHQAMYHKKNDDIVTGGHPMNGAGDYFFPKLQENVSQMTAPATVSMQPRAAYWTENHFPNGVFQGTEHLYMIQTPSGAYGHPQMMKPVTGPPSQAYYTPQNIPPESYSNQQIPYNIAPKRATNVKPSAAAPPPIQPPAKATAYPEGYGVVRPSNGGYTQQVAYDNNVIGRQVYYAAHGGGVMAGPSPHQQQVAAAQYHQAIDTGVSGEGKALNQEAVKVAPVKATQASV